MLIGEVDDDIDHHVHESNPEDDRLHRQATRMLYLATNGIVRLYTTDTPVAKVARNVLLKGANLLAPVKGVLMKKLMEAEKH